MSDTGPGLEPDGRPAVGPALTRLTELVPFLRWRIGAPQAADLLASDLTDPDRLANVVADSRPAWDTDDPVVLASLWWQAYAYRVAGTSLACWMLTGVGPVPVAVGIGRHRASSIVCEPEGERDLDDFVGRLFHEHLDDVAVALRGRHRIGEQLLWGNAAAAVASALLAVAGAEDAPSGLRARVPTIMACLPHEMDALGSWPAGGYARLTCCLWFKTPVARRAYCTDCPFVTRG